MSALVANTCPLCRSQEVVDYPVKGLDGLWAVMAIYWREHRLAHGSLLNKLAASYNYNLIITPTVLYPIIKIHPITCRKSNNIIIIH